LRSPLSTSIHRNIEPQWPASRAAAGHHLSQSYEIAACNALSNVRSQGLHANHADMAVFTDVFGNKVRSADFENEEVL
jgi:hypothetical protein